MRAVDEKQVISLLWLYVWTSAGYGPLQYTVVL